MTTFANTRLVNRAVPSSKLSNAEMLEHMHGCQNCGPFLGTLDIGFRITIGIQEGTIIWTTTYLKTQLFETNR